MPLNKFRRYREYMRLNSGIGVNLRSKTKLVSDGAIQYDELGAGEVRNRLYIAGTAYPFPEEKILLK